MRNVLYLINFAGGGGTERYVETLVRALDGTEIRAHFAYNEPGLLSEKFLALGIPVRQLPMKGRFDRTAVRALAALCREWKIELIHCQFLREHYLALQAKRLVPGLKVLYTNHLLLVNDTVTCLSNRLMDRTQDGIIAVCRPGKEQLVRNGWSRESITVVHNAVDPAAFAGTRADSSMRQRLGIPDDAFVLLYAARLSAGKGHEHLLRALALLRGRTDRAVYAVLAGSGEREAELTSLTDELGLADRVLFPGYCTDMRDLYLGSDLYVSPSESECLSFGIIEAMASGLGAVVTDVGGNPDIIDPTEGAGVLVPYGDAEALAAALLPFLTDPDAVLRAGERARAVVADRFALPGMLEATLRIYERALS